MMTFLELIFMFTFWMIFFSTLPMKMMLFLLSLKMISTMIMMLMSGQSWFSLIMIMIIAGGVMVIMSIMCALTMLSQSFPVKNLVFFSFFLLLAFPSWFHFSSQMNLSSLLKKMSETSINLSSLIILMTLFFTCFVYILSLDKCPMRMMEGCY